MAVSIRRSASMARQKSAPAMAAIAVTGSWFSRMERLFWPVGHLAATIPRRLPSYASPPTAALTQVSVRPESFRPNLPGWYEQGSELAIQPDGKLLVIGRVSDPNVFPPEYRPVVVRYQTTGALDTSFGTTAPGYTIVQNQSDSSFSFWGIGVLSDGRIVSSGSNAGTPMLNVYSPTVVCSRRFSPRQAGRAGRCVRFGRRVCRCREQFNHQWSYEADSWRTDGSASLSVTDHEVLDLVMAELGEEGGQLTATVSRSNTDTSAAITVALTYSDSTELSGPETVVILLVSRRRHFL